MPNTAIFHPIYFPSILQYAMMLQKNQVLFEVNDYFQKQTYRNRCYIYGANGKQLLNVPISKKSGKQVTKDILVNYEENWQKEHVKSLISAYKSSPFFEFYIDEFMAIFNKKEKYLVDLNLSIFQLLNASMQVEISFDLTTNYQVESKKDFRFLVNAKQESNVIFPKYVQVFQNKHSFISNLSILDLLFNEGPNTEMYLMKLENNLKI